MASLTPEKISELQTLYGKPIVIDDVVRLRAADEEQIPILAYPRHIDSVCDYEYFTGKQFDLLIDQACWALIEDGFKVNERTIVALYAESDLSYGVTMLALLRLGYKVMTISARLGVMACKGLLDSVDCRRVFFGSASRFKSTIGEACSAKPNMILRPMLKRSEFDRPESPVEPLMRSISDKEADQNEIALIMHSSGSTGLPKPLYQCHAGFLADLLFGMGCHAFNPLPWFHLHGLLTSFQAMYKRKVAHLWNAHVPMTAEKMISAIKDVKPEILHCVPYILKIIAEVPDGIELMRGCKYVTSGGARVPDELGDMLVKEGVHLSSTFGLTETGHIGDAIHREPGDNSWNYIRLHSTASPHIVFNKVVDETDGEVYEPVFLKSHPALMMSNSDNPPGSYHSGDLFVPHSKIPDAWKYIGRKDDRLTLANGEKINPMGMEGILRHHPLTRDVLMFGNERSHPGILIFQSQLALGMSRDEYIKAIAPALEEANSLADDFARLTPDMMVILPPDVEYPTTDKNNIIRAAAYRIFEGRINSVYSSDDSNADITNGDSSNENLATPRTRLQLDVPALQKYLLELVEKVTGVELPDIDAEFFACGVDSLRAIQIRKALHRDLELGGTWLPTNVVYDARNVSGLAEMLHSLQNRETSSRRSEGEVETEELRAMRALIKKYGRFGPYTRETQQTPKEDVVLLTGVTGALGAHVLYQLLQKSSVRHVYCLVRGSQDSRSRVFESLQERGFKMAELSDDTKERFSAINTDDFSAKNLGLPLEMYHQIRSQVTLIIHAAWPVNFNIPLASFEPHIAGLNNMLQLAFQTPWKTPARVLFASSIATAYGTPRQPDGTPAVIGEGPIPKLSHTLGTGYARSKIVSEKICEKAAAAGGRIAVLRIGQIVGDVESGIWNPKESIPLMIHSSLVVGVLPLLEGEQGFCQWAPVDTMAASCLQAGDCLLDQASSDTGSKVNGIHTNGFHTNGLNGTSDNQTSNGVDKKAGILGKPAPITSAGQVRFYNLVPPHSHTWNEGVLPALRASGLQFEAVSFSEWLQKIASRAAEMNGAAEIALPALKLVDYYKALYQEPTGKFSIVHFDTSKSCRDLAALRDCPHVVENGLVEKFLKSWMEVWQKCEK